ncbi:MAG: PAS domain-containing protein [Tabrizicola sp.]|nr:PAS domain-containing protein [Tabrizicola sp.]
MDLSFLLGSRNGRQAAQGCAGPQREAAELRAYWESLRHDGGIPARRDIDPQRIGPMLERVFVAERIGAGLAQIRIAGSAVNEFAGVDARGLPLSCLFPPGARLRLATLLEQVFAGPSAIELQIRPERQKHQPVEATLLMLPLKDDRGATMLMIGCISFGGDLRRARDRFTILRTREERLILPVPAAEPAPQQAFAEAAPAPLPARSRAHLRLVHSADR